MKTQEAPPPRQTMLGQVEDRSQRVESSNDRRLKRREFCSGLILTSSALLVSGSIFSAKAERGGKPMGSISVACYKPRPSRETELLELVRNHMKPLRAEGLVTDRAPIAMRTADGTKVEVFEWGFARGHRKRT